MGHHAIAVIVRLVVLGGALGAFGLLWLLGLAVLEADDGMSLTERLRLDASLAVFTAGLVFVPAGLARPSAAGHTARTPDPALGPGPTAHWNSRTADCRRWQDPRKDALPG